ncbi:MAG: arginine--tRNA ligase [Desulfarculales bacterium]|nr:arginine--tRNA ligase [Desulfarculales bacterium]
MHEILSGLIRKACETAVSQGHLPDLQELPPIVIESPRQAEHGDFACSLALQLTKRTGIKPRALAEIIAAQIDDQDGIVSKVEIAGPGFINFFIAAPAWLQVIPEILTQKDSYGLNRLGAKQPVMVEYVSANPTGPLHVGHGRGAAFGDALARLLRACGFKVMTEYYLNDAGNQMSTLGRSVLYRARELMGSREPFPANHYQGGYINDLAKAYLDLPEIKKALSPDRQMACRQLTAWAVELTGHHLLDLAVNLAAGEILAGIKKDLADFGVTVENYFSEKSLLENGAADEALARLKAAGLLYEKDGALWFASSRLGDDKDRVIRRGTGELTYFAGDIAYHLNKTARGFTRLIDIWGADHHGYVARLKAALAGLGQDENMLTVLLVQMVRLLRGQELVPMSTRGGQFVTLAQVVEEVGRDSARFIFLSRRLDAGLDFDLDLAKQKSMENPVFYVQYAHTRVRALLRKGREQGIDSVFNHDQLILPEEIALAKAMRQYPQLLKEAALNLEPHRLTYFLRELARMFHSYYNDKPIIQAGEGLGQARLALAEAAGQVLKNGLNLLGISAPESM